MQFFGTVLRQLVNHPLAASLGRNHCAFAQISQVFGNGNLRQLKNRLKMANTERTLREQI